MSAAWRRRSRTASVVARSAGIPWLVVAAGIVVVGGRLDRPLPLPGGPEPAPTTAALLPLAWIMVLPALLAPTATERVRMATRSRRRIRALAASSVGATALTTIIVERLGGPHGSGARSALASCVALVVSGTRVEPVVVAGAAGVIGWTVSVGPPGWMQPTGWPAADLPGPPWSLPALALLAVAAVAFAWVGMHLAPAAPPTSHPPHQPIEHHRSST